MRLYFIRILIFCLLWGSYVFESDYSLITLTTIITAGTISLALYFFLPIYQKPHILFILLSCIPFTMLWIQLSSYCLGILLYLAIEAAFMLPKSHYYPFLSIVTVEIAVGWYLIGFQHLPVILSLIVLILSLFINQLFQEKQAQKEVYEQLLGEYRKLKRIQYEAEKVVRVEERTRIARDIHDSVGHKLTGLLMKIEILSLQNKEVEWEELRQLAQSSLEETRTAVQALKTDEMEGLGSLIQLIRKLESESHIMVQLTTKQGVLSLTISNQQSVVLYRVIQEGLTNAMRHSGSRQVNVLLGRNALGGLEFKIANKIHRSFEFEKGFGLLNMTERMEEIGGKLHIYQANQEFVIEGSFPVKEKKNHVEHFIS
ncbi:sensor histidine kinase [Rossellomorea sp. BNER]|uniref:sensor histidine kinase n=1 Tax=Rossellomorea sp. BNER TaxID=2962031 RepID=UPI003AF1EC18